jgi:hypothetical protein
VNNVRTYRNRKRTNQPETRDFSGFFQRLKGLNTGRMEKSKARPDEGL